jgi:hypothetical protein
VGKRVVALHLILQRPDERDDDSNLLDSTGKLRGYQPYYFAASDFAGGVQKSAYGELRVIDLRKLGLQMRVKVADVHVEPTPADPSQRFGYQFDNLTLEVTTQGLSWQHRVCAVHTLRLLHMNNSFVSISTTLGMWRREKTQSLKTRDSDALAASARFMGLLCTPDGRGLPIRAAA